MATLSDLAHYWGNDLNASASGDLLSVNGTTRGTQRVLRRLLTCPADEVNNLPADYTWHPTYGAGLPRYVGSVASEKQIAAVIKGQMLLESCVAQNPPPSVTVQHITNGLAVTIKYTDAPSGQPVVLGFNVGN